MSTLSKNIYFPTISESKTPCSCLAALTAVIMHPFVQDADDFFELVRVVERVASLAATSPATLAVSASSEAVGPLDQQDAVAMDIGKGAAILEEEDMTQQGIRTEADNATASPVGWKAFLASLGDLVIEVQWKLLVYAERCYWNIFIKKRNSVSAKVCQLTNLSRPGIIC